MAKTTHAERVLTGRLGAYVLHSRYDSRELTRAARVAFESKFERDVDPEGARCRSRSALGAPRWPARLITRGSR
jgi:hypothetical protein